MRRAVAIVLLLGALAFVACDGSGGGENGGEPAQGEEVATPKGTLPYVFRLVGPLTPTRTFFYAVGSAVDGDAKYTGCIVDQHSRFVIEGRPGDAYHIRNEASMSAADMHMRWTTNARGTLGPETDAEGGKIVDVVSPERTTIRVIASSAKGGPDYVTLFDEKTGTSACALRDPSYALVTAAWRGKSGTALREMCPPRPWELTEFAPGPCIVAARTEGHQWMALRADLSPGAALDLDVGRQPKGGGIVICEDPNAVLVLAGEFPIPAPRLTTALQFRSKWDGVPPGAHEVRYPDGRVEQIDVSDGEETRLGK